MTDEELTKKREEYQTYYSLSSLSDLQTYQLLHVDKELLECTDCTGVCKKTRNSYLVPKVQNVKDELWITYAPCKWAVVRQMRDKCKHAQIPPKYANKTFADYKATDENAGALKGAQWLIQNKPTQGLYLYGGTGTGKTFLAALIAKEYILAMQSVIFGDVPTLLEDLKATFSTGGTEQLLERYCNCDLLVLDDLGAGQMTDWSIGVLYRLINSRYNEQKTTLITSNYDFRGLEEILSRKDSVAGKRIVSRLREMTFQVFLGTNDRR